MTYLTINCSGSGRISTRTFVIVCLLFLKVYNVAKQSFFKIDYSVSVKWQKVSVIGMTNHCL